ncbi:MAG: hypothetical protein V1685_00300, partial [Parcubacteria group bacterium]
MQKKGSIEWVEIARRGKSHALLLIDTVAQGYRRGLFREIARRLKVSVQLFRHMMPWEVRPALEGRGIDTQHLKKRLQYCI